MQGHDPAQLTRRILRTVRAADEKSVARGLAWYPQALITCERLASEFDLYPATVVVALAHLSPRTRWAANVDLLEMLLQGRPKPDWALSRSWETASGSLLSGTPLLTFNRRANKTREFARAILGDLNAVAIDSWTARVAGVEHRTVHTQGGYALVADSYRRAAKRFGLPARDFQACCWVHVRGSGD